MSTNRRSVLAALAAAPVAGAAVAWFTRRRGWLSPAPREHIARVHFPDVELVAHDGRRLRFYRDLICGKKVVIQFMYTHCRGICSPVTDNLVRVQQLLGERVGRDLFFYSITLEPAVDGPDELRQYAEDHGVGPGWLFLTGRPADCELLRRDLGFVDPDPVLDADVTNHSGNVLFGNEPLMLWAACPGQADAEWIARSISAQVDRPV